MSFLNCFTHKSFGRDDRKGKLVDEFQKGGVPSTYNGLADTNLNIDDGSDSEYKRCAELSGFDTAREHDLSMPTAMAELSAPQSKSNRYSLPEQIDPSMQFVKELPSHPEYRQANELWTEAARLNSVTEDFRYIV